MTRRIAALRAAYGRWRDAYDTVAALSAHRAMGHRCPFCAR